MIDCYWWAGVVERGIQNFGDVITPHIVRKLSGMEPVLVLDRGGRYLCSGSILPALKKGDIVWGSGVVIPDNLESVPDGVKFCAVRGPLTRDLLMNKFGQDVPEIYGDPCLLIPKLFKMPMGTREFIGIVPHGTEYAEITKPGKGILTKKHILIDITSGFEPVIQAINKCAYVVSSSLHALILADALGIPNVLAYFAHHENMEQFSWKFHDYFLSVNRPLIPPLDCTETINLSSLTYPGIAFDYSKFLSSCPFNFTKTTI
mgnify:CR=1 FL=1